MKYFTGSPSFFLVAQGDKMEVKKILREFIKERILSYIAGILILIAASVISLRIPKILGKVTDMLNKGQGTVNEIRIQLLLMVGFAVLGFVLRLSGGISL